MNYKILDNGQVLKESVPNVWEAHDMKFHTLLTCDKESFLADGEDVVSITVKVYNYLGELQEYNTPIKFSVEFNGKIVAEHVGDFLELSTLSKGKHIVRTHIPNYRNGEIKVYGK